MNVARFDHAVESNLERIVMAASFASELKRKTISAGEAAALVKPGDWLDYGFGLGQPDHFDRALAARVKTLDRDGACKPGYAE